jgi:uncharacterized protein YndB with AHSA1/START domain
MRWLRRILVVLVALPLLAVIGLLLAGRRQGAGHNVERLAIARPPAQVFRHLEDEELFKKWTGLVEVKRESDRWLQPGARSRLVAEARGQQSEVEVQVTAVEKDHFVILAINSVPSSPAAFNQVVEYRLEPRDGGTRLTVTVDTRYQGMVVKLFEPLITRAAQKQLEATLDRLRIQVEAEPAGRS